MKVEPLTMSYTDIYGNKEKTLWNVDVSKDQQAKADYGKAKLSLVPRRIIWDIAAIREYGNEKYHDPDNWRNVEAERYRDALYRHFMQYLDDPYGVDKESGLPTLWHIACNVAFLCDLEDPIREERKKKLDRYKKDQTAIDETTKKLEREKIGTSTSMKDQAMLKNDDPMYTQWMHAFREHLGECEFYRRNIFTNDVQFGDYNPELMKIVPRMEEKMDIHDTDFE